MGRLHTPGRTSRAAGNGNTSQIHVHHKHLPLKREAGTVERDIQYMRQTVFRIAVDEESGKTSAEQSFEGITEQTEPGGFGIHFRDGETECFCEADCEGDILRSRPLPAFLPAAAQDRLDGRPPLHKERPDPLRTVKLVR